MSTAQKPMYEWKNIPWREIERNIFKLQNRIYQASERGDQKLVHKLQRLLLNSWSAKCLAVRRVTQDNQGKRTAGVDGVKQLTAPQRLALVQRLNLSQTIKPVRRIWLNKADTTEKRPLGIPTMENRAGQALVKLALEPEWEAKFKPNSYGFRPGRSAHDAIEAIFISISRKAKYVLDADISKCFDRINHKALLAKLKTFPTLQRVILEWLETGVVEGGELYPTVEGTPQGGVCSPLLANIALHGLEEAITRVISATHDTDSGAPNVIIYADDFVVLHPKLEVIEQAKQVASEWLKNMGLELKPSKTRITHTLNKHEGGVGFDFLGFNVRRYHIGKTHRRKAGRSRPKPLGFKTLIKPGPKALGKHYAAIKKVVDEEKTTPQASLIDRLNPIVLGWANYYSTVVAKETFQKADHLTYQKLRRWAKRRHPNKSHGWVYLKYWYPKGKRWVFGEKNGKSLILHGKMPIKRHIKVRGKKSPYDGDWIYWVDRLSRYPGVSKKVTTLLKKQKGRCAYCARYFRLEDRLEIDHIIPRQLNGKDVESNRQLLHAHCHDEKTAKEKSLAVGGTYDTSQVIEELYEPKWCAVSRIE